MLVNSFRICGNVARSSLVLRISDTYCQATWEFRRASSRQVSYVGFQNKWGAFLCEEHTWNWFDYLARPQLPIIVSGQGFHKTMSDSKELAWPTNAFAANRALCLSWSFMQHHLTSNFAWHFFLGSNFKFISCLIDDCWALFPGIHGGDHALRVFRFSYRMQMHN